MVSPQDEYFHERNDSPFWNESAWFSFAIPERDTNGFIYFYHRPNLGFSVGGCGLWDPTGDSAHTCIHHQWDMHPLAPETNMFDFSLPSGLSVECVEPLHTYRITYNSPDCEMELTWRAFMAPAASGFSQGLAEWAVGAVKDGASGKGHYEQMGRMTGSVLMEGERLEIDCFSARDHSWGPREISEVARGDWPWAVVSEDHAFFVVASSDLKPEQDPGHGTTERIGAGWYRRDGVTSSVVTGTRRAERDPQGRPVKVVIEATDELGRELHAVATPVNLLNWQGYPFMLVWWSLARWEVNGEQGWGEVQDYWPINQSRRLIRRPVREGVAWTAQPSLS